MTLSGVEEHIQLVSRLRLQFRHSPRAEQNKNFIFVSFEETTYNPLASSRVAPVSQSTFLCNYQSLFKSPPYAKPTIMLDHHERSERRPCRAATCLQTLKNKELITYMKLL